MNIFRIEEISNAQINRNILILEKSNITASISSYCEEHGNLLSKINLHAESVGNNSLLNVMQKLINKEFFIELEFHNFNCFCNKDTSKLIYDFSNINEPLRSTFETIFQNAQLKLEL